MRRIQRVSQVIKLVAYAVSVVCVIFAVLSGSAMVTEGFLKEWWVVIYTATMMLVLAAMVHHVGRIAALFEQGRLFTRDHVHRLRAIGLLFLLMIVSFRPEYDPAHREVIFPVDIQISAVAASFVFIFMSWIMDEARKLDEEHRLTV